MEKTDLTSPSYWETPGVDIRLNPRLEFETAGLAEFVGRELGLESAVVFATSGSTGSGPKFVILEKQAILASAEMVNRHLGVTKEDRWLSALTNFHVGGLGVWARAWTAGCPVLGIDGGKWDRTGKSFVTACRDSEITLTALTPTHLHDVVTNRHAAPEFLRAVLIGGAALETTLQEEAVRLGWPILRTYGMTEAASQVATDELKNAHSVERMDALPVVSGWKVCSAPEDRLEISGKPLFRGYAIRAEPPERGWILEKPFTETGYFQTGDRVLLTETSTGGTALSFVGRSDDLIKKLGEQVSLTKLRTAIRACFKPEKSVTIVAIPHDRAGNELLAVVEGSPERDPETGIAVSVYQEAAAPFERIDRVCWVEKMPRTELGKIAHGRLAEMMRRKGEC